MPLNSSLSFAAQSIESTMAVLEDWLQTCLRTHTSCKPPRNTLLPTRVLYIGGSERSKVYLEEVENQVTRYIALSYCWGRASFLKLDTTNLTMLKRGVDLQELPASFQYAINIARGLEIDYIWIDALCIIQDDLRDWEIQSSKMAGIYQNSFLVLALEKPSDPHQECQGEELQSVTIDSVHTRSLAHVPRFFPSIPKLFPLMCRAWAFQERILAPRVLHLGPHELSWGCFTIDECECGRTQHLASTDSKRNFYDQVIQKREPSTTDQLWRNLVGKYSSRALTIEDDRLPAISGIATAMQSARSGTYLAGLWSDSLVLDMLWISDNYKPLRSPSWSWGSGIGGVTYREYAPQKVIIEAKVKGFHCQPEGVSQTGKISSGWIQLKSAIIECSLLANGRHAFADQGGWTEMAQADNHIYFDCKDGLQDPRHKFFMVQMVTAPRSQGWKHREEAILIESVGDINNSFRRIGFAEHVTDTGASALNWPKERRTVTII
jgi:hypothetical protein